MSRIICRENECTGCNACVNVCPKNAIATKKVLSGSFFMEIDEQKCINCGKCEKVCPNNAEPQYHYPLQAYAGWATSSAVQVHAASGGAASSFYRYAVKNQIKFAGVQMNKEFEAHFKLGENKEDIIAFRNSKYTFSFMDDIYIKIEQFLKEKQRVLFIGLPCQVAAITNYVAKLTEKDNLITVDIVCHGTPPANYLQEHIRAVAKKKRSAYDMCYFRDPLYETDKFVFSLYKDNKKNPDYHKRVNSDDLFQIGYHKSYIYRENCYNCKFAKRQRVGDLTISDYWGEPLDKNAKQLSNILVNTEKGKVFLEKVKEDGLLTLYERDLEEPFRLDKQLNHPSVKTKEREKFISEYINCQDYEKAAYKIFGKAAVKNRMIEILHLREIRSSVSAMFTEETKKKIKKILGTK